MTSLILSLRSMRNRLLTSLLTMSAIALSMTLLLLVEHIREGTKDSFANTVSGTDLIVGARTGSVQLLLSSVFRIGNPSQNVHWNSYKKITSNPDIAFSVPISLGDSHYGYRVVGTSKDFFTYYKVRSHTVGFQEGKPFEGVFEAVVGSEVAAKLQYQLGKKLVLAHGISEVSFEQHDDRPFTLVGILERTGTPVDRAVYVSLEGIEAMHVDWQQGAPPVDGHLSVEEVLKQNLEPKTITAFFIGLKSKMGLFTIQRSINEFDDEPLLAILPGATLAELWDMIGVADKALLMISTLVILSGILGMLASLITTLNERRREMAILRALGAHPRSIFALLISEAFLLGLGGVILGVLWFYGLMIVLQPIIESRYGVYIPLTMLSASDCRLLLTILVLAGMAGLVPAFTAYKNSLTDGLSLRL
jgi:putative ABC transport system permease protein